MLLGIAVQILSSTYAHATATLQLASQHPDSLDGQSQILQCLDGFGLLQICIYVYTYVYIYRDILHRCFLNCIHVLFIYIYVSHHVCIVEPRFLAPLLQRVGATARP